MSTDPGPGGHGEDTTICLFKIALVSQHCQGPDGFVAPGLELVNMMDASL